MRVLTRLLCLCLCCIATNIYGQDPFEEFKKAKEQEFAKFKSKVNEEYQKMRQKIDLEYSNMVKKSWKEYNSVAGVEVPKERPVKPIEYDKQRQTPTINKLPIKEEKNIEERRVKAPDPIVPIEPIKTPERETINQFGIDFYGLALSFDLGSEHRFTLNDISENSIAKAWKALSNDKYSNVIKSCIHYRDEHKLCDWAYIQMLNELATAFFGKQCNESTLLAAYLYAQSGYKMRLAKSNETLYMLYASKYIIYSKNYWTIDGEMYYMYGNGANRINICKANFPKEQPLSMQINHSQSFAKKDSKQIHLTGTGVSAGIYINENLINFYKNYPCSGNKDEKWSTYANTPMSKEVKAHLYPALKESISGKSETEAANLLLHFVQTAFEYEYDDKLWGGDRVFFAEETLYYKYSDCEDRSILFAHLIKDLLGLDVVLLYYPGHLATAVKFTNYSKGDYLNVGGNRYTVCDPTYINAPIGKSMPQFVNSSATVIRLK